MLHDLLHHDYSHINLRQVPTTAALVEQKLRSMTPNERWWFQKLAEGRLLPDHDAWVPDVPKVALYQDYIGTLGKIGVRHKSVETELGMFLAKMLRAEALDSCRARSTHAVRKCCRRTFCAPPMPSCAPRGSWRR